MFGTCLSVSTMVALVVEVARLSASPSKVVRSTAHTLYELLVDGLPSPMSIWLYRIVRLLYRSCNGSPYSARGNYFLPLQDQTMLKIIEWNRDNLRKMSGLVEACVGSVAGSTIQLGK